MRDSGEITTTYAIAGSGGSSNNGFVVLTLASWKERQRSQQEIMADITNRIKGITAVRVFTTQPNSLGIRGAGNGLQFAIVGGEYAKLQPAAQAVVAALEKKTRASCSPACRWSRHRRRFRWRSTASVASDLGIDITGLANAVQAVLDGRKIGSVYVGDRSFDVKRVSTTQPDQRSDRS
ncbi:efflux RND transporter permease subunit [Brucella abortus]|nr:efflux RND transporter permease subunit [Brucella abortus]